MRKRQKPTILFSESYRFEGRAKFYDAQNNKIDFVECELRLSPEEVRIILSSSSLPLPWKGMCELEGNFEFPRMHNGNFLAYNLRLSRWTSKGTMGKAEFVAEAIILGKGDPSKWISGIRLHTLSDLVFIGDTKNQYRALHKEIDDSFPWNEVGVSLEGFGRFSISYRKQSSISSTELIKRIVPYSFFSPSCEMHIEEALSFIYAYRSFLSVLKGDNVNYKSISVTCDGADMLLYIPHIAHNADDRFVFKLRRNMRYEDDEDAISDSVFCYFLTNYSVNNDIDLWSILNMYAKSISFTDEEKFLSLFRIIEIFSEKYKTKYLHDDLINEIADDLGKVISEKTSLKSRHIRRFKKSLMTANEMLNTGEQIKAMLKEHETFAEKISIGNADIDVISKLRNDISHATPYFISPKAFNDILCKTEIICYYNILLHLGFNEDYILKYIAGHRNFPQPKS